jgi:hypothetical protein
LTHHKPGSEFSEPGPRICKICTGVLRKR